MPVILANPIVPLSSVWTHERLVNHVRTVTNELDNERIQNTHLRNHVNAAIASVCDILNTAKKPDYGVMWRATLEGIEHASGLEWIDLSTPVTVTVANAWEVGFNQNSKLSAGEIIPSAFLDRITNVTCKPSQSVGEQNNVADVLKTNCQLLSISEIATLSNGFNDQYRQSICYCPYGKDILFHIGSQITVAANVAPDGTSTFFERPFHYVIWASRRPILDNLIPENTAGSSWTAYVDIPDQYMRLVILLAQKMTIESLNKQVDNGTEQAIAAQIAQIQGLVQADVATEKAEREKQKQGFSTR